MDPLVPEPENFHDPDPGLRSYITLARAELDRRIPAVRELLADEHFVDNDERTWLVFDGLITPADIAEVENAEALAHWLAWLGATALIELAKKGSAHEC